MKEYRTHACHALGHPEFSIAVDERTGLNPTPILSYFEDSVRSGARFNDGETVSGIGWMVVTLKSDTKGTLEVWEPQFDSFPVRWIKGATNTLRHLTIQRAVCGLFGCEPDFPSLVSGGLVSRGFLLRSGAFVMSRDQTSGADSGWVFTDFGESVSEDDGEFRSLYEISLYYSEMIAFLALPAGTNVSRMHGHIEVQFRDKIVSSADNDLLRKLALTSSLV